MANTASVLGKVGDNTTARTNTFTNVTGFSFNCAQDLLTIEATGRPSPVPIAIAQGATITLTNTGGNYTLAVA